MVGSYSVCDFDIPYHVIFPFPVIFPYPVNVQEILCNLIPGLPYPVLFTYLVKASICKSTYIF